MYNIHGGVGYWLTCA